MRPGRIPMTIVENDAVDALVAEQQPGDCGCSLTRRDAGEAGPVVAQIGDRIWELEQTSDTEVATVELVKDPDHEKRQQKIARLQKQLRELRAVPSHSRPEA